MLSLHNKAFTFLKRNDGLVEFKDFVENGDLTLYLERMSRNGEWADRVMVMAMASYLRIEILVITSTPDSSIGNIMIWINSGNSSNDVLMLRHICENHYQSLRPKQNHLGGF